MITIMVEAFMGVLGLQHDFGFLQYQYQDQYVLVTLSVICVKNLPATVYTSAWSFCGGRRSFFHRYFD